MGVRFYVAPPMKTTVSLACWPWLPVVAINGTIIPIMASNERPLFAALRRLLRPLVRVLLDRGVAFEQFAEIAKGAYVEVAEKEFGLPGRKQSVSRISVLTGLTRKEVVRLREAPIPEDAESAASYNRAARVVTGWRHEHPLEGTASGAAPLSLDGPGSFADVVRRYSGDMPVRAVLDELLRVGAVRMREREVELVYRHYIPPVGETRKLVYLGEDAGDLIATIGHNLSAPAGETRFQRKAFYDNVPVESLPALRALVRDKGERVLDELAREMSRHDRDVNPAIGGSGRMRTVVGIYFAEEALSPENASPPGATDDDAKRTNHPATARGRKKPKAGSPE